MKKEEIKKGNVLIKDNRKTVVTSWNIEQIKEKAEEYEKVCDRPHQDGDYSYVCDFEYCRCSS